MPAPGRLVALRHSLPAAAAAGGGFLFAMAPLVGSGRAGVLGYILNDDPVGHSALIELLQADGLQRDGYEPESYWTEVGEIVELGYPLGSHAWPMFSGALSTLDTFYVWTPSVAVAAAMLSLVAFATLRRLSAEAWPAAVAAVLVPVGYLSFSFIVAGQREGGHDGGRGVRGDRRGSRHVRPRPIHPRGSAARDRASSPPSSPSAWARASGLALPALVFLVIAVRRAERVRATPRMAVGWLLVLGLGAAALVPAVSEALGYVRESEAVLTDASRPGNLLGAVPWQEVFNVWFAYDYRVDPATYEGLSRIGAWLGAAFAVVGVGFALLRRELALPLIVASGAIAAVVISRRYTIYLEAKGYAILAPALAIAAAAAVLGLLARPGAARVVGAVGAVLLVEGVLAGAALRLCRGLGDAQGALRRDRRDRGPLPRPGADAGRRSARSGAPTCSGTCSRSTPGATTRRTAGSGRGGRWAPPLPHTPDFDDYSLDFVERLPAVVRAEEPRRQPSTDQLPGRL